jgi:hypothetical protein
MKKLLIILTLFLNSGAFAQSVFILSHPISGAVYQRDNSGNATMYFCGQANRTSASTVQYRLHTLNKTGGLVSSSTWETVATVNGSDARIFRFSKSVSTGWYRAEIRVLDAIGSVTDTHNVWFGVGEVFIIAGQSNAQGYGTETYGISGLTDLECVRSLKNINITFEDEPNENGEVTDIVNLKYPSIGPLTLANRHIGLTGARSWFYQKLGNDIAENATSGKVTPVMFLNAAVSGSSIYNWKSGMLRTREMFSNNYSNNINTSATNSVSLSQFPKDSPWGWDTNQQSIFTGFKSILSLYGNIFGVRAVLWHQGEAETRNLINNYYPYNTYYANYPNVHVPSSYNIEDYEDLLTEIINESRVILPGLNWAISKVSLTSEKLNSTSDIHFNIVSNASRPSPNNGKSWVWSNPAIGTNVISPQEIGTNSVNHNIIKQQELTVSNNSSHVSWFTQASDSYSVSTSSRQSDNVHFNNTGLSSMAGDAYTNIVSNVLSKTPVSPTPPPILSIYNSGGANYTSSVSSPTSATYSRYQWEYHYGYSYNDFDQSTSTTTNSFTSDISTGGYVKDNVGRIHLIPFAFYIHTGMRRSADNKDVTIFPNPISSGEALNVSFDAIKVETVRIEIYSENGTLLHVHENFQTKVGSNTLSMNFGSKLKRKNFSFAFVHVVREGRIDKIKLMIE